MKLSPYSWMGYGFAIATIYGAIKYGWNDYRVMGIFILTICFLMVDVVRYYIKK